MPTDNQELAQLEQQLSESIAAEHFFQLETGRLLMDILSKEVTKLTREVISNKYLKDHMGYVNAVAAIKANQGLIKRLHAAASPQRKAKLQERIEVEKDAS